MITCNTVIFDQWIYILKKKRLGQLSRQLSEYKKMHMSI